MLLRPSVVLVLALSLGAALGGSAHAEIQRGVPEVFPSRHELSTHLGFQAGFGGKYASGTSGFKLEAEYAYKFHPIAWFDVSVGNNFGFGNADGRCANTIALNAPSCYYGGFALELMAGVKFKFPTRLPIVIEVPVLLGVEVLYNRECGDNGAAVPALRTGAGGMYFLTPRIGVGMKIDFAAGPGFHGKPGGCFVDSHSYTDFFGYVDFMFGAEFFL
jgi:hypothetical protein